MYKTGKKLSHFPCKGLPIGTFLLQDQEPTDVHEHDFTEVAIIQSGSGEHLWDGAVIPVTVGDVFVINRRERHAWMNTRDMTCLNVLFDELGSLDPLFFNFQKHPAYEALFVYEPKLRRKQKGRGRLRLNRSARQEACRCVRRLDATLHSEGEINRTVAQIQLLNLLNLLCDAYLETPGKEHKDVLRVGKAISLLDANLQNPPNGEELAGFVHATLSTFYRLFRRATGGTPAQYVNQKRIELASELLLSTDETISQIAFKVGYKDSNYFSIIFRRLNGLSPSEFRKTGMQT